MKKTIFGWVPHNFSGFTNSPVAQHSPFRVLRQLGTSLLLRGPKE
jgi:hypothetical protein